MVSLRPCVTAGFVVVGAALGAAIVTVPLTEKPPPSAITIGVSAADEPLPQPQSPPAPAPVPALAVPVPAAPVSAPVVVAAPAPVESAPVKPATSKWAFTPNEVRRSVVLEARTSRGPAMSTPTGSGGAATSVNTRPMAPEGIAQDLANSATTLADQTREVLGALMGGAPED